MNSTMQAEHPDPHDLIELNTPAAAYALDRAICGAIGWIAAGTNEGNNGVAQEIIRRLQFAARHFRLLGDGLQNGRPANG